MRRTSNPQNMVLVRPHAKAFIRVNHRGVADLWVWLRESSCSLIRCAGPLPQRAIRLHVFTPDQLAGVFGAGPRMAGARGTGTWPDDYSPASAMEDQRPLSGHSHSSVYP